MYEIPFQDYLNASVVTAILWTFLRGIIHNRIISVKEKSPNHLVWGGVNGLVAALHSLFLTEWSFDIQALYTSGYMLSIFWLLFDPFLVYLRNNYFKRKGIDFRFPWNYISSRKPSEGGSLLDYIFHKIPNVQIALKLALIGLFYYLAAIQ